MTRCLLILAVLLCANVAAAGVIEGRVVLGDEAVAGIAVRAYRSLDFSLEAVASAAPTDADGHYRLELPPGEYALFASDAQRQLFAFCGRNPVRVDTNPVWAGLQAVHASDPVTGPYDAPYTGSIDGRVLYDGKPLAGAYVYLYLSVADALKGLGHRLSVPTGADGYFAFDDLAASRYFIAVRMRQGGGRVGPILAGDYLGIYPGNPLALRAGQTVTIDIETVRKVREERSSETFASGDGPVVQGMVVDAAGNPVAGVHVFAYTDRVIGHKRPAALSAPTAADGSFVMSLPDGGRYFIGARQNYGDSPAPGELFGMYEESSDHGFAAPDGESVTGLRIVVEPIRLN